MDKSLDRVVPFDELDDFDIAEGDPDIRGWDVHSSDGRKIGEVDNLLIDTGAMKVRYLDVDVDDDLLNDRNDDRHILVPIGYARLDEENDHVMMDNLASTDVMGLPVYTHAPITREFETEVRQSYDTSYNAENVDRDFYAHSHFDDNNFYRRNRGVSESTRNRSEGDFAVGREQMAAGSKTPREGDVNLRDERSR